MRNICSEPYNQQGKSRLTSPRAHHVADRLPAHEFKSFPEVGGSRISVQVFCEIQSQPIPECLLAKLNNKLTLECVFQEFQVRNRQLNVNCK